jgi:putative transposase
VVSAPEEDHRGRPAPEFFHSGRTRNSVLDAERKRSCRCRGERLEISAPNETWAMDFMSDTLFDDRVYRILTVVDCPSRESLAIEPRRSFGAFHVVEALDRIARERGKPKTIPATTARSLPGGALDRWAFFN